MGNKSIRIGMNRDQVARAENALVVTVQIVNRQLAILGKDVGLVKAGINSIQAGQELFYDTCTWAGRWRRLKKWLSKK